MAISHAAVPLVGRETELSELTAAYDDAVSGNGRIVMLVGEPGIGKTRLAEELAASANGETHALWGRCPEQQSAPPYWPWVQLIRAYIATVDAHQLRSEIGLHGPRLAELVPEIRVVLPDLDDLAESTNQEQARFELFDAVSSFFFRAASSKPLLLILDDIHWTDSASLKLLEFAAVGVPDAALMILGTYRDVELSRQHPLTEALGSIGRSSAFRRIPLSGLSEADVGELITAVAGTDVAGSLVHDVRDRTNGNPFFVSEIARDLVGPDGVAKDEPDSRIPEGVHEAIGRRLSRLSDQANEILTTAAVIGRDFTLGVLGEVSPNASRVHLLGVVDEALNAGLIEEQFDEINQYRFTHALVQETLADKLSVTQRVRLHARIGEALEDLYGDLAETNAVELAHHFGVAQPLIGSEKLIHYSIIAGEQALAAFGYEDALRLFQGAEAAAGDGVDDAQMAAILAGQVRAWVTIPANIATRQQAWDKQRRAFDLFVGLDDHKSAVDIALAHLMPGGVVGALDTVRQALKLVDQNSEMASSLQNKLASLLTLEVGDLDGARVAANRARAIAREYGNLDQERSALAWLSNIEWNAARPRESIDFGMATIQLALRANSPFSNVGVAWIVHGPLLTLGDPSAARSLLKPNVDLCRRLHQQFWGLLTAGGLWNVAAICGDQEGLNEARSLIEEFSAGYKEGVGRELGVWMEKHTFGEQDGEVEDLLRILRRDRSERMSGPEFLVVTVVAAMRAAAKTELLDEAESLAALLRSTPPRFPLLTNAADVLLGFVAVARSDREAASKLYKSILPRRGQACVEASVSNDNVLGLLARTAGRTDEAAAHFEDALQFCRNAGYRPELAWTCFGYAEMLLDRDDASRASANASAAGIGDRERAGNLLDEAVAITSEIGITPLETRVIALKERISAAGDKSAPTDGLTPRQIDVLRLVAVGRTSQEIADELVISINTVARHVAAIFQKTGASNRTEAAAYAIRQGLDSQD